MLHLMKRKVTRLHRARGIYKQGEKLKEKRTGHADIVKRIQAGDRVARKQGLRGEARYAFVKATAGLSERTDDAQIRRYLREGRNGK